jgi:hypothetical protein
MTSVWPGRNDFGSKLTLGISPGDAFPARTRRMKPRETWRYCAALMTPIVSAGAGPPTSNPPVRPPIEVFTVAGFSLRSRHVVCAASQSICAGMPACFSASSRPSVSSRL